MHGGLGPLPGARLYRHMVVVVPKDIVISIVDDDESVRQGTMDLLEAAGFAVEAFPCAEDFLTSSRLDSTSCLIAEVQMPGMTGIELHNRLRRSGNVIPTILITAYPDDRDRARALQAGVTCYLSKPYNGDDMVTCVRSALEYRKADRSGK
jgi:FixJ family two-component response regulator